MKVHLIAAPFDPRTRSFDATALQQLPDDGFAVTLSSQLFQADGVTYLALALAYREKPEPVAGGRSRPRRAAGSWGEASDGETPPPRPPADRQAAAPGNGRPTRNSGEGERTSYLPQRLSAAQLELYERLREWRYQRARSLSIPPYLICSNRELEEIVLRAPRTVDALAATPGLTEAKLAQHGAALAAELDRLLGEPARS